MLKILTEIEMERVRLCLKLINRFNKLRNYGYSIILNLKSCIIDLVYYSSRLMIYNYYIDAFNYYMFQNALKKLKIYFNRNRFTDKDYWLIFEFIITFISDFTIDDFYKILSKD